MIRSDPSLAAKSTTQHNKTVHSESKILSCPSRVSSPSRSSYVVSCVLALSRITRRLTVFFSSCLLILSLGASPAIALDPGTLPEGGVVISGAASTSTQDAHMQIETSQNVSIDWQTFNIGSQASVTFHQPNSASVALNRVLQAGASEIYGSLTANGQVFLLNPSGVIFGAGAQVDINGGLVASSLSLNDADFASGNYAFHNGTGSGAVENHGSLKGRYVVLLGETIENTGSIVSGNGGVAMVAADSVTLGMPGNELVTVEVTRKALTAAITNEGAITALGGNALLATAQSMDNLLSGVINNTGSIKATRINNTGGTVTLIADGDLENTGTITANAAELASGATLMQHGTITANRVAAKASDYNQAGTINADAGTVSVDAATIYLQGTIDASATNANSNGGTISLTSTKSLDTTASARLLAKGKTGGSVSLDGGAHGRIIHSGLIDATGTDKGGRVTATAYNASVLGGTIKADGRAQGGTINWGGNYQGKGTLRHATQSLVSTGSQLTTMGEQGGTIVIWSTDATRVGGTLKSGSKGSIEVSSKGALDIYRSARLLAGAGGTLLLDPKNIIIDDVPGYTLVKLAFGDRFHDFGRSVSFGNGGRSLAVGAPNDNTGGGSNRGAVYLFEGLGTGATIGTPRLVNTLKHGSSLNSSSSFAPGSADTFSTLSLKNDDNFGQSVALRGGRRLVVGAPGDDTGIMIDPNTGERVADPNSSDRGAVYIFEEPFLKPGPRNPAFGVRLDMRLSDETVLETGGNGKAKYLGLKNGDNFGYAVAFNGAGDRLAVGAPGDTADTGAVYLFNDFGARYTEKLHRTAILRMGPSNTPTDGAPAMNLEGLEAGDRFGAAVALDQAGNRLVVGAPGDDGKDNAAGEDSGAVYLFDSLLQDDGRFHRPRYAVLLQSGYKTLTALNFGILAGDEFGAAVAFGGSYMAVGAPGDNADGANSGAVHLFDSSDRRSPFFYDGGNLLLNYAGKLTRSSISTESSSRIGGEFGAAVAFSSTGDRLAIGAPGDDDAGEDSGAVYLFGGLGTGRTITLPTAVAPTSLPLGSYRYTDFPNIDRIVAISVLRETLSSGSSITLQASNDITWNERADLDVQGSRTGGNLTLAAGRSLILRSNITTNNGDLTFIANDTVANGVDPDERDEGAAVITMDFGTRINTGKGNFSLELRNDGANKDHNASGNVTLTNITGNSIKVRNEGSGNVIIRDPRNPSGLTTTNDRGTDSNVSLYTAEGNVENFGNIESRKVTIIAGKDVRLRDRSTVRATGTGDALTISVGREFINEAGPGALGTSSTGRWLVWSNNPGPDRRGNLPYDFKQYNAAYSNDMAELHQDERGNNRNGLLYTKAPTLEVELRGEVTKPFDGDNTASLDPDNYKRTGDLIGDNDEDFVRIEGGVATYDDAEVGKDKLVTVNNPVVFVTGSKGNSSTSTTKNDGADTVYGYRVKEVGASDDMAGVVSGGVGVITAAAPAPDPTPDPVVPDPVVPTPDPVVPDPVVPTPDPVVPTPDPVVPTPDPVVPAPDPVVPTPDPVVPDPVVPTPDPVVPTPDPVVPTPDPVVPDPVVPTPDPVVPTPDPVVPAPAPAPTPVVPAPAPAPTPVVPAPAPTPVVPAPAPTPVVPAPAPAPVVPAPAPTPVVPAPAPTPVVPAPAPQSGSTGGGQSGTSTNNNDQMPEPEQEMLSSERQEQQQAASFIDAAEHAEASESTTSNTGHISYASSEESPLRLGCPGGSAVALSRGTEDQEISSSVASLTCQSQ